MRLFLTAALAAVLFHTGIARAGEWPSHDEAISRAAIEILQKKLPDFRRSLEIGEEPKLDRKAIELLERQDISALAGIDLKTGPRGRILWL